MPVTEATGDKPAQRTLPEVLLELEDAIERLEATKERAEVCANEARIQLQELTGESVGDEDTTAPAPMAENTEPPTDIVSKVSALQRKLCRFQNEIEGTLEVTQGRQEAISRAVGLE